jgi:hypothetical protein
MKYFLMLVIAAVAGLHASAKVWRVNNTVGINANFNSLSTAISNASVLAGDTIYVEGSATSYGTITVSKALTIIGPGYNLTSTFWPQPIQYNTQVAELDAITINAANTSIAGLFISGQVTIGPANNASVSRCYVNGNILISGNTGVLSGVRITQNWVYNNIQRGASSFATSDLVITNNHVFLHFLLTASCTGIVEYNNFNLRNTAGYGVNLGNAIVSFRNNIIRCATGIFVNAGTSAVSNNIAEANILPAGNGNQNSIPMTGNNMFVNALSPFTDTDANYQLSASSPAKTAGVGSTPIGAYGGLIPYVRSGIPAIPTVYGYTIPVGIITSPTVTVTFSSRTNN